MSEIDVATLGDATNSFLVIEAERPRLDTVARLLSTNEEVTQLARSYAHDIASRLREHYNDYLSQDALAKLQPSHLDTHIFVADSRDKLDEVYGILLDPGFSRDTAHDDELILGEYHTALGGIVVALAADDVLKSPTQYTHSWAAAFAHHAPLHRHGETADITKSVAAGLLFDTIAEETTHMVQDPLLPVAVREVLVNYHMSMLLITEERTPTEREEKCRRYCKDLNDQLAGIGIPDILDRLAFGAALPPYVRAYTIRQIKQQAPVLLNT